jgi:hypothetical protein
MTEPGTHSPIGVKDLFWTTEENLRYAKRQQFAVANYVILVFAALFSVYTLLDSSCAFDRAELARAILVLASVITIFGYLYICSFQFWMVKSRRVLNKLYRGDTNTTRAFRCIKGECPISDKFWKDGEVAAGIIFLESASYAALSAYLAGSLRIAYLAFFGAAAGFFVVLALYCCWIGKTKYLTSLN